MAPDDYEYTDEGIYGEGRGRTPVHLPEQHAHVWHRREDGVWWCSGFKGRWFDGKGCALTGTGPYPPREDTDPHPPQGAVKCRWCGWFVSDNGRCDSCFADYEAERRDV